MGQCDLCELGAGTVYCGSYCLCLECADDWERERDLQERFTEELGGDYCYDDEYDY